MIAGNFSPGPNYYPFLLTLRYLCPNPLSSCTYILVIDTKLLILLPFKNFVFFENIQMFWAIRYLNKF